MQRKIAAVAVASLILAACGGGGGGGGDSGAGGGGSAAAPFINVFNLAVNAVIASTSDNGVPNDPSNLDGTAGQVDDTGTAEAVATNLGA